MSRRRALFVMAAGLVGSATIYYLGILCILWRREPRFWWPGPDFGMPLAILSATISLIIGVLAIPWSTCGKWQRARAFLSQSLKAALTTDAVWIVGYGLAKSVGSA